MKNKTIYGDEAGFTGENMLDKDQPYFCYSTVALEEKDAESIIEMLRDKYHFQNEQELKGKTLFSRSDSLEITKDLLEAIDGNFITTIDDKKFTVCCRLFEYIFEPVLAENNSIFYTNHFHLTIANMLYLSLNTGHKFAKEIFDDLYNYLRWGEVEELKILFKEEFIETDSDDNLMFILKFAFKYKDIILKEFSGKVDDSKIITPDWMLDLSITKVNLMLSEWGSKYDELTVILDDSKPLFSDFATTCFEPMINRKGEQVYIQFGGKTVPITYNLKEQPLMASSKDYYGIQVADLVSSLFLKSALNMKKYQRAKDIFDLFLKYIDNKGFIFPNIEYLEIEKYPLAFINRMLLDQMKNWLDQDISPLEEVVDFYLAMFEGVLYSPPDELSEAFSKYRVPEDIYYDFEVN